MNSAQASHAWEMPESEVKRICEGMGIEPDDIPDDTVPVYVPISYSATEPHRYYTYLLQVIANTHMEIKGIDQDILETCVEQLKEKKLIILKHGADPDSLDYHDYVVYAERALYHEWDSCLVKSQMSFIDKILSIFKK